MPYKPRERELFPEWIYEISIGDDDFLELLVQVFVARNYAIRAIRERGRYVPKLCRVEFEQAEETLDAIRKRIVSPRFRIRRAATALRKFVNAHQCARFLESDSSKVYARDSLRSRRRSVKKPTAGSSQSAVRFRATSAKRA